MVRGGLGSSTTTASFLLSVLPFRSFFFFVCQSPNSIRIQNHPYEWQKEWLERTFGEGSDRKSSGLRPYRSNNASFCSLVIPSFGSEIIRIHRTFRQLKLQIPDRKCHETWLTERGDDNRRASTGRCGRGDFEERKSAKSWAEAPGSGGVRRRSGDGCVRGSSMLVRRENWRERKPSIRHCYPFSTPQLARASKLVCLRRAAMRSRSEKWAWRTV